VPLRQILLVWSGGLPEEVVCVAASGFVHVTVVTTGIVRSSRANLSMSEANFEQQLQAQVLRLVEPRRPTVPMLRPLALKSQGSAKVLLL
jgi:hypothetical protein